MKTEILKVAPLGYHGVPAMAEVIPESVKAKAAERAISALAKETETSTDLVRTLYLKEVSALDEQARVKQYVGVIATRIVRQRLRELRAMH
jgi:Protein of unknown function (DUF3562)